MTGRIDDTARIAQCLEAVVQEVRSLRREVASQREERELSDGLLRQDVATKVLTLQHGLASRYELFQLVRKLHRQVVCLRADSQREHARLLEAHGLSATLDGWPNSRDFAEVRAMDPEPRPAELPPDPPADDDDGSEPHGSAQGPRSTLDLPSHLAIGRA